MAQLSWRDIAAPDLSTSIAGIRQFGDLLTNAVNGAKNTVNEIDQGQTDRANTAALQLAAAAQNSDAAKALLASPAIQGNNRLTASTILALQQRPGQLTQQAAAENALADQQYADQQNRAADALAGSVLTAQQQNLNNKDGSGTAAFLAANPNLGNIGLRNAMAVNQALDQSRTLGVDLTGKQIEQAGMKQNQAQSAQRFQWDVRDDKDRQAGMQAALDVQASAATPEQALAAFSSGKYTSLSPGAKTFALQSINNAFGGNIYQPNQIAAAAGSSNPSALTMQVGGAQLPSNVQTLGQAVDYGQNTLIPATRNSPQFGLQGTGKGTSAMGMYQITSSTLKSVAPMVFGANWRDQNFADPQVQDKLGQKIFDMSKGSAAALQQQWASLTPAQAQALVGKDWSQARDIISHNETGSSASAILGTSTGAGLRLAQDNVGKSSADALTNAAINGPTNPRDVVAQLQTGAFKGTNTGFLNSQINDIVNRSKVNGRPTVTPAMAGQILSDALRVNTGNESWLHPSSWGITNYAAGNSARVNSNGDRLNNDYITNEINRAKSGGLVQDTVRNADVSYNVGLLNNAQTIAQAAKAEYQATLMRLPVQPGLADQLPRLKAKMDAANAAVIAAQSQVQQTATPITTTAPTPSTANGGGFTDSLRNFFGTLRGG